MPFTKILLFGLIAASAGAMVQAQTSSPSSKPAGTPTTQAAFDSKWNLLVGDWTGEGSGDPGQGVGSSSFHFDLQNHILIRRSHSDYPAGGGRPATTHDDMMVIYPGAESKPSRAIYFDNEGHVIHYIITWSESSDAVTFLSEPAPNAPRFRLTYKKARAQSLSLAFEIAPPNQPDAFKSYLAGRLLRAKN